MPPSPLLNVGIVGFGRIGAEHAAWLEKSTSIRPAAIADPTAARRAIAAQRNLHTYESAPALFDDPKINAILISTPTSMHFDQACAALNAGKHVMIEKPMALNLAQAQELVNLARSHKKVLSVFHNRRWDPDYLTLRLALQSSTFGKLINIESRLSQWSSCVGPAATEYRPNWRNESSYGGGGLFDWGSHFIDQLWRLMWPSRPQRVFAQLRGNIWSTDCDDFARVCIDFDNNAVAMLEINTTTTRPLPRWHIDGSQGSADSPHSPTFDTHQWAEFDFIPASSKPLQRLPVAPPGLSEPQIWDQFASAIHGNGEPAVTPESVLPTMALLDAARESSRLGIAIELSPSAIWVY